MKSLPTILIAAAGLLPLALTVVHSQADEAPAVTTAPASTWGSRPILMESVREGKARAWLTLDPNPSHPERHDYDIHFAADATAAEAEDFIARSILYCLQHEADPCSLSFRLGSCPAWTKAWLAACKAELARQGKELRYYAASYPDEQEFFESTIAGQLDRLGLPRRHLRAAALGDLCISDRPSHRERWGGSPALGDAYLYLVPGPRHEGIGYGDAETLLAAGTDELGRTPLHRLAAWGQAEALRRLVAEGAEVNARDENELTPLHAAAQNGHTDCVRALIAAGADANAGGMREGHWAPTPLQVACRAGWAECVRLLLAAGADVNAQDSYGNTPLHEAAARGHADCIALLAEAGADVNAASSDQTNLGTTPLHHAAFFGQEAAIRTLIAAGAGLTPRDDFGRPPLHLAAERRDAAGLKALLAAGADTEARDDEGETALHVAVSRYEEGNDALRALLAAGAKVNVQDKHGRTPLHIAAAREEERLRLLLAAGAEVNAQDAEGNTPLHEACRDGWRGEATDLLIKAGGNMEAVNKAGEKPEAALIEE